MKKLFASLLAFSLLLVGCGGTTGSSETPEIVMLTDSGSIDDKSFNQGTYEGIQEYCNENDIVCNYLKPADVSTDDYCNAIDQAVAQGAKIVVCPGYLFEEAIYIKQTEYPDVKFILIDGNPHDESYEDYTTADNVIGITFQEEQSGYLAGYMAVMDGNTSLGFMGGTAVPAVIRYGFGYVQGANDAAAELGITVDMRYYYTGSFDATPETQTKASSWYKDGISVIFGCGGSVGNSVMAAAEASNPEGKVIGVDVDQYAESDTVITSAYKQLAVAVQDALASIYSGDFDKVDDESILFRGGQNIVLGADYNATGLALDNAKFEKVTQEEYDEVYAKIADGTITIVNDSENDDPNILGCTNVNLTVE